jgi:pimeloyl-ACP methyl ester carboxylesterase
MASTKPLLLIHGTWCNAKSWGDFIPHLEALGFEAHAPSLRFHEMPLQQMSALVALC